MRQHLTLTRSDTGMHRKDRRHAYPKSRLQGGHSGVVLARIEADRERLLMPPFHRILPPRVAIKVWVLIFIIYRPVPFTLASLDRCLEDPWSVFQASQESSRPRKYHQDHHPQIMRSLLASAPLVPPSQAQSRALLERLQQPSPSFQPLGTNADR